MRKQLLFFILMLCVLFCALPLAGLAEEAESPELLYAGNFGYYLVDGKAYIFSGQSEDGTTLTIPQSIDGYEVAGIGTEGAFYSGSLDAPSVIILEGVRRISDGGFNYSTMGSITLPETLESIGKDAFSGCEALITIRIPAATKEIAPGAFLDCPALTSIDVDGGNPVYYSEKGVLFSREGGSVSLHSYPLGKKDKSYQVPKDVTAVLAYAFYYNQSLTSVKMPDTLTSIGDEAFNRCSSLSKLALPKNLVDIGREAFAYSSKIKQLILPGTLKTIGDGAFATLPLAKYELAKGNETFKVEKGVLYTADGTKLLAYPIASKAKVFEVPKEVNTIGAFAFASCKTLQQVSLPEGLSRIEKSAFSFADRLNRPIALPGTLEYIGDEAFFNYNLPDITLPESLKHIGNGAFRQSRLLSVTLPDSLQTMGDGVFQSSGFLRKATLPRSLKELPKMSFFYCENLSEIDFPEGFEAIGEFALGHCGFESITLPSSLQRMDYYAFGGNEKLLGIAIPDSVTQMGMYIFSGCTALKEATLPSGTMTIPDSIFSDCTALRKVIIPEGPDSFGSFLFSGCRDLTVFVPDSLFFLTYYTFYGCDPGAVTIVGSEKSYLKDPVEGMGMVFKLGTLETYVP